MKKRTPRQSAELVQKICFELTAIERIKERRAKMEVLCLKHQISIDHIKAVLG